MKYTVTILTFLLLASLAMGSHVSSQTSQDEQKPLYYLTGNEGNITGTISVTGAIPKPLKIDMTADPVCLELVREPETESIVARGNKLKNAFVYLKGEQLQNHRFEAPASEVKLQHNNCQYSPHVIGMQTGQPLHIINSDSTSHNTHPVPRVNQEWNVSQAPYSPELIKTFRRPETVIPFKCNQHPWERAYVGVLDHPYFAVSDSSGRFEIRDLPPGAYKLVVWHEKLGEQELDLTLTSGETRGADFTFDADKP